MSNQDDLDALEEARFSLMGKNSGVPACASMFGVSFSWIGLDIFRLGDFSESWSAFRRRILLRYKHNNSREPNVTNIGTIIAAAIQRSLGLLFDLDSSMVRLPLAVESGVALGDVL